MKLRLGGQVQSGGTNPVGNQAASYTTDRAPYPPGGMDNPRIMFFWLGFVAILFVFHVGGARLP